MSIPARVHGVDFSGAIDAGRRIWIASGVVEDGTPRIVDCRRAEELPGSGRRRERALAALRELIAGERAAAIGLDFPFGLPAPLVPDGSWVDFALAFAGRYPDPEAFRHACVTQTGGRELKRLTDLEARTPFSSYNLRLYRQTYAGIRDLLAPLVRADVARVVPMQPVAPDRPWLLEICPASTLKRASLYRSYKGQTLAQRVARERILASLGSSGALAIPDAVRRRALDDPGGDALDSLIAAAATSGAVRDPSFPGADPDGRYAREGRVYS